LDKACIRWKPGAGREQFRRETGVSQVQFGCKIRCRKSGAGRERVIGCTGRKLIIREVIVYKTGVNLA
jgi:hypothetical protein